MRAHTGESIAALRRALGASSPPATLTQEAFDRDPAHLRRLVKLGRGEPAKPADLWDYSQDLRYTAIQRDLFTYLLPVCLQAWRDDLRGSHDYVGFVEHFYPVLADRHVFDTLLTVDQTAGVAEFMRHSILAEIDGQRGLTYSGTNARPYRWIRALTTYGVLLPDVDRLWTPWWDLSTIGRAVSSVQYLSALIYPDKANPIFAAWTPNEGGGPPCLWEFEGHLYSHRWLDPNVDFLRRTLTVQAVADLLARAVDTLRGEPEHEVAARASTEVQSRAETLTARCAELPRLLATTQATGILLDWPV
jgi:hypothetical protein